MAEIALILFQIAIVSFAIAVILWVISSFLSKKKRQFIETVVSVIMLIGIILAVMSMVFDYASNDEIEYVECEHCGSQIPKEEYNP